MSRASAAVVLTLGIGAGALGALGTASDAGATVPAPPPVVTVAPTGTVPGAATPTTPTTAAPVVPPAGARGGASAGSIAKPVREAWSLRRIATMTGLCVIALAAAGYAYGKMRSAPPRHPDLVRRPEDVEAAG